MHAASFTTKYPTIFTLQQIHCQIEALLATLQTKADTHMWKSTAQHKSDYGLQMREALSFQVGSYVFVDKLFLATTSRSSTDSLASSACCELQ